MTEITEATTLHPSLDPNDQANSRLLQLPAEVRLIILRQLLQCDKPISSLGSTDDIEYFNIIQRSAQLLRTCQLLHKEGVAILYNENTLCIDFMDYDPEAGEETVHYCGILQMFLPIPEKLRGNEEELLSLVDYATPKRATDCDNSGLMAQHSEHLRRQWTTLQKFKRYEIRIQYATQHVVLSASRMLQDLLIGKDIRFILNMVDEDDEYRVAEAEFDKTAAQMLQSCRTLRCRSVVFEVQDFMMSPQPKSKLVADTEDLVVTITGRTTTHDTYSEWASTRKRLLPFFDAEGLGDFEEDYEEDVKKLQQAAMDYNRSAYNDKLQAFAAHLKEDVTKDSEDSIAVCDNDEDIANEREELGERITRIETQFGSARVPCQGN